MRWLLVTGVGLLVGCAHSGHPAPGETEEGDASYYGPGFYGRKTASGEVLRPGTFTAAHRTLPFGTCVQVTVVDTGRTVQVRINDRGPFVAGRILDVSETAARALGMVGRGVARVRLTLCQSAFLEEDVERLASATKAGACGRTTDAPRPGHLDADAVACARRTGSDACGRGQLPASAQAE